MGKEFFDLYVKVNGEFETVLKSRDCIRTNTLDAIWHCVIPNELGHSWLQKSLYSLTDPSDIPSITELNIQVQIPLPWYPTESKLLKVKILYLQKLRRMPPNSKHHVLVKDEDVSSAFRLKECEDCDQDVTLLIGYSSSTDTIGSLLCCRFHRQLEMKSSDGRKVLKEIQKQLKNNGIERRRTGGSSGKLHHSHTLMKMMKTPNSSPRMSKGTIYLEGVNENWYLYYINIEKRKPKRFQYSNPIPGGQILIPDKIIHDYACLKEWFLSKPLCGALLKALSDDKFLHIPAHLPRKVSPLSYGNEVEACDRAWKYALKMYEGKKKKKKKDYLRVFIIYLCKELKLTLAVTDAPNHLDVFPRFSLENRKGILLNPQHSKEFGKGRSGNPDGQFVFVLLDWGVRPRRRRVVWTDPNNQHIEGAASSFPAGTRLNRTRWLAMIANANAAGQQINLPPGVTNLNQIAYPEDAVSSESENESDSEESDSDSDSD